MVEETTFKVPIDYVERSQTIMVREINWEHVRALSKAIIQSGMSQQAQPFLLATFGRKKEHFNFKNVLELIKNKKHNKFVIIGGNHRYEAMKAILNQSEDDENVKKCQRIIKNGLESKIYCFPNPISDNKTIVLAHKIAAQNNILQKLAIESSFKDQMFHLRYLYLMFYEYPEVFNNKQSNLQKFFIQMYSINWRYFTNVSFLQVPSKGMGIDCTLFNICTICMLMEDQKRERLNMQRRNKWESQMYYL
jgi:hypothetical protein